MSVDAKWSFDVWLSNLAPNIQALGPLLRAQGYDLYLALEGLNDEDFDIIGIKKPGHRVILRQQAAQLREKRKRKPWSDVKALLEASFHQWLTFMGLTPLREQWETGEYPTSFEELSQMQPEFLKQYLKPGQCKAVMVACAELSASPKTREMSFAKEGVLSDESVLTHRTATIQRLTEILLRYKCVLVRGPYYSGKSTLSKLLRNHLMCSLNTDVRHMTLVGQIDPFNWETTWSKAFPSESWSKYSTTTPPAGHNRFLIIDEAQLTYTGADSLWTSIKGLANSAEDLQTYIILFSLYGAQADVLLLNTPFTFSDGAVVGLFSTDTTPGLLLTEVEFAEVIQSFERAIETTLALSITNYIYHITRGYVGFVKDSLRHLWVHFQHGWQHPEFTTQAYLELHSGRFANRLLDNRVGTKSVRELTDHQRKICEDILLYGNVILSPDNIEEVALIKTAVLVLDPNGHLQFSSRIVMLAYLHRFHTGPYEAILSDKFTFETFITEAIQRIRPDVLKNSKGVSVNHTLLERQWQMEFHRACTSLLPYNTHYISPDVGAIFNAEGYLDFYINGNLKWAIELLREGTDMAEHARRFEEGGNYAPMLPVISVWAIIDFRSEKKAVRAKYPNMWHVKYADDMKSFRLVKPGGEVSESIPFVGSMVAEANASVPAGATPKRFKDHNK